MGEKSTLVDFFSIECRKMDSRIPPGPGPGVERAEKKYIYLNALRTRNAYFPEFLGIRDYKTNFYEIVGGANRAPYFGIFIIALNSK